MADSDTYTISIRICGQHNIRSRFLQMLDAQCEGFFVLWIWKSNGWKISVDGDLIFNLMDRRKPPSFKRLWCKSNPRTVKAGVDDFQRGAIFFVLLGKML